MGKLVFDRQTAYRADATSTASAECEGTSALLRPFGGSRHVFAYLGRYTHRVAISNQRLVVLDDHGVHFVTKDKRVVTLEPAEFIRCLLDHVLPRHFVKIRHCGLYASANVHGRLKVARALLPAEPDRPSAPTPPPTSPKELLNLDWRQLFIALAGVDIMRCPQCDVGTFERHDLPHPGSPSPHRR